MILGWRKGRAPETRPDKEAGQAHQAAPLTRRGFLEVGGLYRVDKAFVDYDGMQHEAGEIFTITAMRFDPAEDMLVLALAKDDKSHHSEMRLQDRAFLEGPLIANDEGHLQRL